MRSRPSSPSSSSAATRTARSARTRRSRRARPAGRSPSPASAADAPFLLDARPALAGRRLARRPRVSTVFIPAVLRAERRRRQVARARRRLDRRGRRRARRALPVARRPAPDRGRRPQPVRQRLRQRPGRPLPRRARHAGRDRRRGPAAAGDGRRLSVAMPTRLRRERAARRRTTTPTPTRRWRRHGGRYDDILDAIGHTPLVEIPRMSPEPGRPHLRQARDAQPDRARSRTASRST